MIRSQQAHEEMSAGSYPDSDTPADEPEGWDVDGFEAEKEICPICGPDISEGSECHLVLSLDREDGAVAGPLRKGWLAVQDKVEELVRSALMKGRESSDTCALANEVLKAIRQSGFRWHDAGPRRDDCPSVDSSSEFEEVWTDHVRYLTDLMEEKLLDMTDVFEVPFEVDTAPGHSWSGSHYFAANPEDAAESFVQSCVEPLSNE